MKVPSVVQYDKFKIAPKRFQTALTHGKQRIVGHQRSFSERATLRTWEPNIHHVKLYSEALDRRLALKATSHVLRCVDKAGGLDSYLQNTPAKKLDSKLALWLRDKIAKQQQINTANQELEAKTEWHAQALAEHFLQDSALLESIEKQQDPYLQQQDQPLHQLQQAQQAQAAEQERFWNLRTKRRTGRYKRDTYKHKAYFLENQVPEEAVQKLFVQAKQTKERVEKYVARMAKKASSTSKKE